MDVISQYDANAIVEFWEQFSEEVVSLTENWQQVENTGFLAGYTWEFRFRSASTATAMALSHCRAVAGEAWDQVRLIGMDADDWSEAMPVVDLSEFDAFVQWSIETFSQRWLPVDVVRGIDDERRYILESAMRNAQTNASGTNEGTVTADTPTSSAGGAENNDPVVAATSPDSEEAIGNQAIPEEYRSKAMSKTEALRLIGWPSHAETERQAIDWLTASIRGGEYRWEKINHKVGVFDIRQFPEECRKDISKH